jgi:hypothetical protein
MNKKESRVALIPRPYFSPVSLDCKSWTSCYLHHGRPFVQFIPEIIKLKNSFFCYLWFQFYQWPERRVANQNGFIQSGSIFKEKQKFWDSGYMTTIWWDAVLVAHGYSSLRLVCLVCIFFSNIFVRFLFLRHCHISVCVCMKTHVSHNCFGVGNFPPPVTPPLLTLHPPTQVGQTHRWKNNNTQSSVLYLCKFGSVKLVNGRASGRIVYILSLSLSHLWLNSQKTTFR